RVAMEPVNEPYPRLGQPARRRLLLAERARDVLVQPVEPAGGFILVLKPEDFGDGRLHAKRELVRLDPSAEFGVVGIFERRKAIELSEQVGLDRRFSGRSGHARPSEWKRVGRIDLKRHPRVLGPQVVRVSGPHALVFDWRAHRDELWQVITQSTQTVVDPRADRGMAAVEQVAAGEEFQLSA